MKLIRATPELKFGICFIGTMEHLFPGNYLLFFLFEEDTYSNIFIFRLICNYVKVMKDRHTKQNNCKTSEEVTISKS